MSTVGLFGLAASASHRYEALSASSASEKCGKRTRAASASRGSGTASQVAPPPSPPDGEARCLAQTPSGGPAGSTHIS
jgi:hypothetical protein